MTTPTPSPAPSARLILQTAQALSITADPPEPWASLTQERRVHWKDRAREEHGLAPIPAAGSRVVVVSPESPWCGRAGEVNEVLRDATDAPWVMVALDLRPDSSLLFAPTELETSS